MWLEEKTPKRIILMTRTRSYSKTKTTTECGYQTLNTRFHHVLHNDFLQNDSESGIRFFCLFSVTFQRERLHREGTNKTKVKKGTPTHTHAAAIK